MQYTIEELRSVKDRYTDPPYPGFSLDEVCRRRRQAQTKLERGKNAWQAKGTAQTTEEWVQRLVQGSLNKMSERNFDSLLQKLRTKELFATDEILASVVNIIFQKALDEPENSKLYAALCFSLAMYEANLGSGETGGRRHSKLRDTVLETSRKEFKEYRHEEKEEHKQLSDEDREFLRASFMRRKKANIRFVGELFLHDVVAATSIFSIIEVIMRAALDGGFPESENIELLAELFLTTGETLDKQAKPRMDTYFNLLAGIGKRADNPYPHRIRFKIMDLLDLRKSAWGAKAKQAKPAATTSGSSGAAAGKRGPASPTSRKGKGDAGKAWREAATKRDAPGKPSVGAGPLTSSLASRVAEAEQQQQQQQQQPAVTSSLADRAAAGPVVVFERRVRSLFAEWVADRTNDFVPQWIDEFNNCDRAFASAEDLCVAVAMEVIKEACATTRKDAQREASSFLIVGLFLMDKEMFSGFAGAIASAIDDGLLEDVPKFPERLMFMLRISSSEDEVSADVYYDAASILCMAYNALAEPDEYSVETLLQFWAKVPVPDLTAEEDERVLLVFPVLYSLCECQDAKPGLERLIGALIHSMHDMGIVEDYTIEELLTAEADANPLFAKIVTEYKLLQGNKK